MILLDGEKNLQKTKILKAIFIAMSILMLNSIRFAMAQEQTENTQTFFEFQWPGIKIQVNATRNAVPEESMTVIVIVKSTILEEIDVEYLDLDVFGFKGGQNKTLLGDINQDAFILESNETMSFNDVFPIPEDVWGVTYGELSFEYYNVGYHYVLPSLRFILTYVENVKLETLQEELQSLSENFTKLYHNYTQLEGNYTDLKEKYDEISEGVTGIDNARNTIIVLAITTVVFAATTIYFIMRKPKQSW